MREESGQTGGSWETSRDHVRFHSCQPRTQTWGCSDTVSPTGDIWRIKNVARSDGTGFLLRLSSESGVDSRNRWTQPALCGGVMVWEMFSRHPVDLQFQSIMVWISQSIWALLLTMFVPFHHSLLAAASGWIMFHSRFRHDLWRNWELGPDQRFPFTHEQRSGRFSEAFSTATNPPEDSGEGNVFILLPVSHVVVYSTSTPALALIIFTCVLHVSGSPFLFFASLDTSSSMSQGTKAV